MKGKGLLELKLKVDGMRKCLIQTMTENYDIFIAKDIVINDCNRYNEFYKKIEKNEDMNKGIKESVKAIAKRYYELKRRLEKYKEYELIDKKDIAEQVESYLEKSKVNQYV